MRLVIIRRTPTLPMGDCELASSMIQLFGRRPRGNWHRTTRAALMRLVLGGLAIAGVGVVLTILLFTL